MPPNPGALQLELADPLPPPPNPPAATEPV